MLNNNHLNDAYANGAKLGNKVFAKLMKDENIDIQIAKVGIMSYKMSMQAFKVMADHEKATKNKATRLKKDGAK